MLAGCGSDGAQEDSSALPGEGVTVSVGVASWSSAMPVVAVYRTLLEELGYEVDPATEFGSNPIFYQSVALGDIDFWPNGWFPLHNAHLPSDFAEGATILPAHCPACGLQGYLVNASAVEEFEITSLQDFSRDEVKAAFDSNGDGRADLFGCPSGWGCHEVINFHLEALCLEAHIDHATAAYPANFANALARIETGENALYYTWTPNDTILELVPGEDVEWINVVSDPEDLELAPSQSEFETSALIASGLDGAVADPINLGFVAADIHVVANNEFLENNPAAATLFENVRLPLGWISEATLAISEGSVTEEEIAALAEEFIAENESLTSGWLEAAREAGE